MIGEVGHFALIWVAISSTLFSAQYAWQKWSLKRLSLSLKPISRLNGVLASLSLICLAVLFLSDQFQFNYVAAHSNVALNDFFKIAAVWGGPRRLNAILGFYPCDLDAMYLIHS